MAIKKTPKDKLNQIIEAGPQSYEELQLTHIKYNLYLVFKAICAQIIAGGNDIDPKDLAIEAERLASYLDKTAPRPKTED